MRCTLTFESAAGRIACKAVYSTVLVPYNHRSCLSVRQTNPQRSVTRANYFKFHPQNQIGIENKGYCPRRIAWKWGNVQY